MGGVCNLPQFWSQETQMAKEHVEYSLVVCIFNDTKCIIMPYMIV